MTYVQLIRAPIKDEAATWAVMDRWERDLRPGAVGFVGSTAGVTESGEFVLVARFQDEASAPRNATRPEQGAWWEELEATFSGPATFFESGDIDESMGGGSDDAGFVQLMIGTGDREVVAAAIGEAEDVLRRDRPDILGGYTAWSGERFVDVAYFTSEAEARAGESKELSEEGRAAFERFVSAMAVEEYLDLASPRFSDAS